jgi:CheY-like chemotaxis protein
MRILVANQDKAGASTLGQMLSSLGACDFAEDSRSAFTLFRQAHDQARPYDLVSIDAHRPSTGSLQLLKEIRNWEQQNQVFIHGQEAHVLVVTSPDDHDERFSCFRQGCEWYISTPVTEKALQEGLSLAGVSMQG